MFKRLPPLNSLKAFESAARHLSFTKAAEEMFVTQAAVSHQIKLLEDFLGIQLFKRKNRALELTELGTNYFNDIRCILNKLANVTDKLVQQKNVQHLTISVPQTFGIHWLVPRLAEFNAQYPEIEVRIKGVDQDESRLNDEIDVAVYYGYGHWNDLQSELLAQENLQILASPKLLAENPIYHPDDLKNHTLIHVHSRENWQMMLEQLRVEDVNVQHGLLFSHTFMALQAAILGQGIVLANRMLAQQEIAQNKLQIALPSELEDPKAFYLVIPQTKTKESKVQAFEQWILQAMASKKVE
ncbi:LysR family glycine cleavage system transcriptional activator [Cricetibacter osteomyelitidis]|uniref:LysR family glycine cleavage system transcriptional activator n=1 Tax=Cricetibacter osteomyelitidis TaxID=1521931 RepID=A0A4R2TFQ3_9PAST|nr:transcriptional regulator GcvA [Cricetibacter osteomyelitidis]TCP93542.1 LysR family glycine cleavage system transcriptional activator [Cricetibacter osteomyelitidis]